MEFARLGRSGPEVSRLSIGTMTFGTQMDEQRHIALLDRAYEAGVIFFDTAEIYPVAGRRPAPTACRIASWTLVEAHTTRSDHHSRPNWRSERAQGPHLPWVRGGATAVDQKPVSRACEASLKAASGPTISTSIQAHWPRPENSVWRFSSYVSASSDRAVQGAAHWF